MGEKPLTEIGAYVYCALDSPAFERDLLAHALNGTLNTLGVNGRRASSSRSLYPAVGEGETGNH